MSKKKTTKNKKTDTKKTTQEISPLEKKDNTKLKKIIKPSTEEISKVEKITSQNTKTKNKLRIKTTKNKEKIYSIACILLIIDQLIKILVKTKMNLLEEISIIPNFFSIYYVENEGAAFSILENQTFILVGISVICLFLIDKYISKEANFSKLSIASIGIIIGGILGNLIDRLLYQKVTDYLSFTFFQYSFAVFNIADVGITVGTVLLIISIFLSEKTNKLKNSNLI